MQIARRYELVAIDKIVPYSRNPRLHSKEQIAQIRASFREFGILSPCLVDENYNLIAGHGRLLAAQAEGIAELNCVVAEGLTENQKKAFVIADNKLTENSTWDEQLLALEIADLKEAGFGLELTGFNMEELEKMFENPDSEPNEPVQTKEDDYDVGDGLTEKPPVESGDIWHLGNHRLMCGDSTDSEAVARLMGEDKARICWTDPPWNVDFGGQSPHPSWKKRAIQNDNMSDEDFYNFVFSVFKIMADVSETGCMVYIAMSGKEWANLMTATREAGYHWSSTIIWAKNSHVISRKDYHTQYEPIWYGWLDGSPRLAPLEDRKQSDLWHINRPIRSDEHPTMKPVELVGRALNNSSRKGDIVLDLFGGSGTTLIASEQTERVARLMEIDPKYVWVIVERFKKLNPDANVYLMRDGKKHTYAKIRKSV
jgi:DNA modification methylase